MHEYKEHAPYAMTSILFESRRDSGMLNCDVWCSILRLGKDITDDDMHNGLFLGWVSAAQAGPVPQHSENNTTTTAISPL